MPEEEEEFDDEYEEEEAEEAARPSKASKSRPTAGPTKSAATKRRAAEEEEEEGEEDDGKSSIADRFNSVLKSFSNNASDVPPGMYEAIISEAVLQEPDDRGQSVRLKFELCDEQFADHNVITQWFRIFDSEGEPFAGGIRSLQYNMAKLGHEFDFDSLKDLLDEISEEKPGIIAKVEHNPGKGKDARIFTNVSVDKPCDNDVIQAYKDNVVY